MRSFTSINHHNLPANAEFHEYFEESEVFARIISYAQDERNNGYINRVIIMLVKISNRRTFN